MFKKRILLITFSLLISLASVSYGAIQWGTYSNARFDYELEYPADIFYIEENYEDERSEGVFFTSSDYTRSLWVEAELNPQSVSLREVYYERIAECEAGGAYVVYKPLEEDSFILSGYESNGDIFYIKHISRCIEDGYVVDVWFTARYPEKDRKLFDVILEHMVETFRFVDYCGG